MFINDIMNDNEFEILEIHIKNNEPLELMEFVNSLSALSNEFTNYCKENSIELHKDTKLYIQEIKQGSIIARLKAVFNKGLDVYKTSKSISNFYNNRLKPSINCLLGKEEKNTEISKQTIKNTANIVSPNIRDNKSQMIFSFITLNIANNTYKEIDKIELSNAEQNIIQNRARLEIENLDKEEEIQTEYTNIVFYWEQTTRGVNKPLDKGILKNKDLPKKAVKVIMEEDIKEQMIAGDVFGNNYIVNASVLTGKNNKIIAYNITKLIDIIK